MSAQTMRRLVKLAYAKQEKTNPSNTVPLSSNGKKKHIQRGKTLTNVRVQRGVSTEQKVAHRLSVTMNQQKQAAQSLHIRSFSLPKEKTPQITEEQQKEISSINGMGGMSEMNGESQETQPTVSKHSSHPTITITPAMADNEDNNDNNNNNSNNDNDDDRVHVINNLPSSTVNNMASKPQPMSNNNSNSNSNMNMNNNNKNRNQLNVDSKYTSHVSTASETHTINSEFSETVYTENTEFTKDDESQYGYTNLKPSSSNNNVYKGRGGGSLMSVGSASSMTMSTYDSSHRPQPNVLPPALETVNEPSANNINNMKYADEEMLANHSSHIPQQSVVQHMTAPQINLNMNDEDEDDEIDDDYISNSSIQDKHKSRPSIDLLDDHHEHGHGQNESSSIWSCLMCGCCCNNNVNDESTTEMNMSMNMTINSDDTHNDHTNTVHNDASSEILQLDTDDWRTFKSGGSRIRRPTQYTTVTNNEDSTINVDDIRMWDDPFGKGASGRVFKGLYLPLCQIVALKVTSRLDNDNVKQILGEFKQQQDVLPDCDELMRIHGWYRNLATNEIAVALEYMDMGSVYDSCFNTTSNKSAISLEEQIKTGHEQIVIDKLSYDQLRFIARQSLLGLHALHSNSPPLIHRDIKPQNILLSSYGSVKIADFGLLIELKNGVCTDSKGTSKYFSPERIQGSFDTHADIWSLGITLIEIYKQELISAEDLDWFKIVEDGIDIYDFLPATTPTEFTDFLKQCLQHQSENRPSAKQLLSHQLITRKWGNPLNDNNLSINVSISFVKQKGNQKLLDKILSWLEEWILFDSENNAKLFLEGDSEYLKQCVFNLSKYSGLPPKYIDRYIADLYREFIQFD